jgi:hypothetical protein
MEYTGVFFAASSGDGQREDLAWEESVDGRVLG